uniref:Uncharacterized protein n=1 Tax=Aeromonas salmonicida subsp. salmonicida TaxID=29491 RepID=A0A343UNJ8_AERSS|nr:hypothetical protein [Aeromonas salmonicida subsp. salmonicida]
MANPFGLPTTLLRGKTCCVSHKKWGGMKSMWPSRDCV